MCQLNKFFVKGMVCQRCISIVQKELFQRNIPVASVTLGEVILEGAFDDENIGSLRKALEPYGFEVMDDRQSRLVREVKALIEEMFSNDLDLGDIKFASYISGKLYRDYPGASPDVIASKMSLKVHLRSVKNWLQGIKMNKQKQ
jgi:AraC family transcriptional regulator